MGGRRGRARRRGSGQTGRGGRPREDSRRASNVEAGNKRGNVDREESDLPSPPVTRSAAGASNESGPGETVRAASESPERPIRPLPSGPASPTAQRVPAEGARTRSRPVVIDDDDDDDDDSNSDEDEDESGLTQMQHMRLHEPSEIALKNIRARGAKVESVAAQRERDRVKRELFKQRSAEEHRGGMIAERKEKMNLLATLRTDIASGSTVAGNGSQSGTVLQVVDKVRHIDGRPAVSPAEKATLPLHNNLYSFLLDVFVKPVTFQPADWTASSTLVRERETGAGSDSQSDSAETAGPADKGKGKAASKDTGAADGANQDGNDSALAQFYVRRLVFPNQEALDLFLRELQADYPDYTLYIDTIRAFARAQDNKGMRCLLYGGMTVAGTPWTREEDDEQDASGSLAKYALKKYTESGNDIEVWEVRPLRFFVPSRLEARADIRLSFFESLVIDSCGFVSLNTAPPGIVIDYEPSADTLDALAAIDAQIVDRSMYNYSF